MSGDLEARLANLESQLHGALVELKQIKEELVKKQSCRVCEARTAHVCQDCRQAIAQQLYATATRQIVMDEIK
jgi:ribosomal protein L40E